MAFLKHKIITFNIIEEYIIVGVVIFIISAHLTSFLLYALLPTNENVNCMPEDRNNYFIIFSLRIRFY